MGFATIIWRFNVTLTDKKIKSKTNEKQHTTFPKKIPNNSTDFSNVIRWLVLVMDVLGTVFHLVCSYRSAPSGSGRRVGLTYEIFVVRCSTAPPRRAPGSACSSPAPSGTPSSRPPEREHIFIQPFELHLVRMTGDKCQCCHTPLPNSPDFDKTHLRWSRCPLWGSLRRGLADSANYHTRIGWCCRSTTAYPPDGASPPTLATSPSAPASGRGTAASDTRTTLAGNSGGLNLFGLEHFWLCTIRGRSVACPGSPVGRPSRRTTPGRSSTRRRTRRRRCPARSRPSRTCGGCRRRRPLLEYNSMGTSPPRCRSGPATSRRCSSPGSGSWSPWPGTVRRVAGPGSCTWRRRCRSPPTGRRLGGAPCWGIPPFGKGSCSKGGFSNRRLSLPANAPAHYALEAKDFQIYFPKNCFVTEKCTRLNWQTLSCDGLSANINIFLCKCYRLDYLDYITTN